MDTKKIDNNWEESYIPRTQESYGQTALRNVARTGARAAETIAGLPGDVSSGLLALGNLGISKLTGKPGPLPEKVNLAPLLYGPGIYGAQAVGKLFGKDVQTPQINLPGSQQLKEKITEPLTGEYLKPQGKTEETLDDITRTAASIFMPGQVTANLGKGTLAATKGISKEIAKTFGKAAAADAAKWGTEKVTGSKLSGEAVKLGTLAGIDILGGLGKANALQATKYNNAYESIPLGELHDFSPQVNEVHHILNTIDKRDFLGKEWLKSRLNRFLDLTKEEGGRANPADVAALKKDWNAQARLKLGPDGTMISKDAQKFFKEASDNIKSGLEHYGVKNKTFRDNYSSAEELTGALRQRNRIQEFLDSHPTIQSSVKNPLVQYITGAAGLATAKHVGLEAISTGLPIAAAVGAGTLAAKHGLQVARLLSQSASARDLYKKIIVGSLKNDSKSVLINVKKLDKIADKLVPESSQEEGDWEESYVSQ